MASRSYAQISCTLPASKKMRQLQNHKSRWTYLCAHLSLLGNYTGMFRYPVAVWADDAALSIGELRDCIDELVGADLIEFDPDEQIVRIVAWFHKKNCPENASRMINLVSDYNASDGEHVGMYSRSVSEFIVGSVRRAQGWKSESSDWPKLRECFQPFLSQTYQDYGEQFLDTFAVEVLAAGKAVRAEICSLFPICGEAIALLEETPCTHPVDTLRPHKTTQHKTYTTQKQDLDLHKTGQVSGEIEQSKVLPQKPVFEVLRKEDGSLSRSARSHPHESTKRSRLAMEAIEKRSATNG
ncbi:MAG: hypothetical protein ABJ327_17935 [Litoreibacter sp.]